MRTEKLSFEHKALLHQRLANVRCGLSEYSFANLYLFRTTHDYHLAFEDDSIFVTGKTYDGLKFVMPTVPVTVEEADRLLSFAKNFDFIFPIPEEWLGVFTGKEKTMEYREGDSDYVYTVEKLATYKGQKLHGQKNLLNQFLSLYTPTARPLTRELMGDAAGILETWQQDVGIAKEATDYYPCREALARYDELVLCGGIYYVAGEPAGFVIGEEIRPDMFALHFAKGKRKFKGLYQYMYNHFAKILPRNYAFLNFEQDLGILALKIAKSSYDPDHILKKHRIRA